MYNPEELRRKREQRRKNYAKTKPVREELKSIMYLEMRINKLVEEVKELRGTLKITSYKDDKNSGDYKGDLSSLIVKIEQQESKINELIDKQIDLKHKWGPKIEKLGSPTREVMEMLYFHKDYNYKKVGQELFYSPRYIEYLVYKAIQELAEIGTEEKEK